MDATNTYTEMNPGESGKAPMASVRVLPTRRRSACSVCVCENDLTIELLAEYCNVLRVQYLYVIPHPFVVQWRLHSKRRQSYSEQPPSPFRCCEAEFSRHSTSSWDCCCMGPQNDFHRRLLRRDHYAGNGSTN